MMRSYQLTVVLKKTTLIYNILSKDIESAEYDAWEINPDAKHITIKEL